MCFSVKWYDDTIDVSFQRTIPCGYDCIPWELHEEIQLRNLTRAVRYYEEKLLTNKDVVLRWIDESPHPRRTSFEIDIDQMRGMIQDRLKYLDGIDTI